MPMRNTKKIKTVLHNQSITWSRRVPPSPATNLQQQNENKEQTHPIPQSTEPAAFYKFGEAQPFGRCTYSHTPAHSYLSLICSNPVNILLKIHLKNGRQSKKNESWYFTLERESCIQFEQWQWRAPWELPSISSPEGEKRFVDKRRGLPTMHECG